MVGQCPRDHHGATRGRLPRASSILLGHEEHRRRYHSRPAAYTTSMAELEIDGEVHQEAREPGNRAGKPSQDG